MEELQRILEERFSALRDHRTSSVFFVEHGLVSTELGDLLRAVREAAQSYSLDDDWWRQNPLPLLVAATEIGYKYLGPGNDFWPLLQDELRIEVGGIGRLHLRDLFSDAAARYRGAAPAEGPWSSAFHIIAWPITHALLPVEFHRPLASTLASIRLRVADLNDENLYGVVRATVGRTTARFETFLHDKALVVAITRALLDEDTSSFSPDIVARINADLALDSVARRDVALARRVQRSISPSVDASRRTTEGDLVGTLRLVRREGSLVLEAALPRFEADLLERVRRALRRHRFAPSLWGVTDRFPGEQLLSGLPFPICLSTLPSPDALLLPDLAGSDLDDDVQRALSRYSLFLKTPSIYAVDSEGEIARQIAGPDISGFRRYWVLHEERWDSPFAKFPKVGALGPLVCAELDPATDAGLAALRQLRFNPRFGTSISIAGDPPLDTGATVPEFAIGDLRLVVPRRLPADGAVARLGGTEVNLTGDLLKFKVKEGEHSLEIEGHGEIRQYPFRGVDPARRVSTQLCWIDLLAPEMSVQALLSGDCALRIDATSPLDCLEVSVELETSGRVIGVTFPLGPLPQVLATNEEPWSTLLDDQSRAAILQCPNPRMRVRVGSIAEATFQLEQRVRPCWWERSDNGYSLQSELGEIGYGVVDANDPVSTPVVRNPEEIEVRLLCPLGVDASVCGPIAEFSGLCQAPSRIRLGFRQIAKPHLQRRRQGVPGRVGLEELTLSYLRWSLADSDGFTAELRRKQVLSTLDNWVAELCCGEEWARRESEAETESSDRWRLLLNACLRTGLGRDPYVELSDFEVAAISRLSVAEIRRARPDLWIRLDELTSLDYEALDLACGRAYEALADEYMALGNGKRAASVREGDPGTVGDDWQSALRDVRRQSNLLALSELLLPTQHANRLMNIDYSLMSIGDIRDELARWTRDAKRALAGTIPPKQTLGAILALWVAPSDAVRMDWKAALDTLLAERCVARAARYIALRWKRAQLGGFS